MEYLQAWPDGDAPANVAAWLEAATSNAIVDRARARADQRRPADNFATSITSLRQSSLPSWAFMLRTSTSAQHERSGNCGVLCPPGLTSLRHCGIPHTSTDYSSAYASAT